MSSIIISSNRTDQLNREHRPRYVKTQINKESYRLKLDLNIRVLKHGSNLNEK